MKFFIFTCLLAVALAKHKMEQSSSSEESVNISQEKFKQEKKMIIHPIKETTRNIKEMEHSSSSSSEESAGVPTENKMNKIYQKLNFLQYLQALRQPQVVINPLDQIKTSAYPFYPMVNREQLSTSEESASLSQEEIPKSVDMESTEVFTQETKLTKENKNFLKLLNKMAQYYQKFPLPQYFKTIPYQTAMKPWNHIQASPYQVIPTVIQPGAMAFSENSHKHNVPVTFELRQKLQTQHFSLGEDVYSLTGKSIFYSFLSTILLHTTSMFGQAY